MVKFLFGMDGGLAKIAQPGKTFSLINQPNRDIILKSEPVYLVQ